MEPILNLTQQIETSNFLHQEIFLNVNYLGQNDGNKTAFQKIEVNNNYRFIKGNLVLFGKQPDGDSIGFIANNYSNFSGLIEVMHNFKTVSHQLKILN
jgi:hypothetical protein